MDAPLLTPAQVARRLSITLNTTYVWLREGRIPGIRMGHRWRVRPEALDEFLGEGGQASPAHGAEEPDATGLFDFIDELTRDIPREAWDVLPRDGSVNHDHYLYGARRRRPDA